MKNMILFVTILAAMSAVAQQPQPPVPLTAPKATTLPRVVDLKIEAKLPDVKPETKLAIRDAQTLWLTVNLQIDQLEKQLADAKASKANVEKQFQAAYDSATAEAKKAGVDTDKNELVIPVGPSSEIKWQLKKEAEVKK
jgi:hypothetical protein